MKQSEWGNLASIWNAYDIASKYHYGQKDKVGAPYIEHCMAVASMVEGEEATTVALLHNVLEDTEYSSEKLKNNFGEEVYTAVDLLTKKENYEESDYLWSIAQNRLARQVKLADLCHNMDVRRYKPKNFGAREAQRTKKYVVQYGKLCEYIRRCSDEENNC